jgi:hypothetical protein
MGEAGEAYPTIVGIRGTIDLPASSTSRTLGAAQFPTPGVQLPTQTVRDERRGPLFEHNNRFSTPPQGFPSPGVHHTPPALTVHDIQVQQPGAPYLNHAPGRTTGEHTEASRVDVLYQFPALRDPVPPGLGDTLPDTSNQGLILALQNGFAMEQFRRGVAPPLEAAYGDHPGIGLPLLPHMGPHGHDPQDKHMTYDHPMDYPHTVAPTHLGQPHPYQEHTDGGDSRLP